MHKFESILVDEKLIRDLRLSQEQVDLMTPKMKKSAVKVYFQQGGGDFIKSYYSDLMGCLMMEFKHIVIGVEKDGYAHS